jgi:hypothetical protein
MKMENSERKFWQLFGRIDKIFHFVLLILSKLCFVLAIAFIGFMGWMLIVPIFTNQTIYPPPIIVAGVGSVAYYRIGKWFARCSGFFKEAHIADAFATGYPEEI